MNGFSLEAYGQTSYTFYQKFHRNVVNRYIHVLTIPMLIWTIAFMMHAFSMTGVISLAYVYLYYLMDPASLVPMSVLWGGTYVSSCAVYWNRSPLTWYYVGAVHAAAWVLQLIGHRFFEGNRPALTESVTQAFVTAPLFVYYEIKELL